MILKSKIFLQLEFQNEKIQLKQKLIQSQIHASRMQTLMTPMVLLKLLKKDLPPFEDIKRKIKKIQNQIMNPNLHLVMIVLKIVLLLHYKEDKLK